MATATAAITYLLSNANSDVGYAADRSSSIPPNRRVHGEFARPFAVILARVNDPDIPEWLWPVQKVRASERDSQVHGYAAKPSMIVFVPVLGTGAAAIGRYVPDATPAIRRAIGYIPIRVVVVWMIE